MKYPLIQLLKAHFKEYLREPGALFWSFGFPILMALGLGLAFSGDKQIINDVAIVPKYGQNDTVFNILVNKNNEYSDTIIEKTFNSGYNKTTYKFYITSWQEARIKLKRGIVSVIVTENNNILTYHSDPLNPKSELINIQLEQYFKTGHLHYFEGKLEKIDTKGLRYIDFLIPGLMGLSIMMSVMWGISYTLIEKRSKKLLRRMVATPMRKYHFFIAQWLSRILLTFFEAAVLLGFSYYFFQIEIQGSIIALILLIITGNFCFFGIAILISSRTSNTQLGNGLISFITTPMMILSGIFFSYQNFPDWAISFIKVMPLTRLVDEMRSVINEGAGFIQSVDGILILSISGIIFFLAGMKIYKWY